MAVAIEEEMAREGWVPADDNQPGIYVRRPDLRANDPLDWNTKPTGLLKFFECLEQPTEVKDCQQEITSDRRF